MPRAPVEALGHAQALGWHDVLWGLAFVAAVALAFWAVQAWSRRRRS